MSNNYETYCMECKRWYYGRADYKVCPVCGSKLLSAEDKVHQERKYYREVFKSER